MSLLTELGILFSQSTTNMPLLTEFRILVRPVYYHLVWPQSYFHCLCNPFLLSCFCHLLHGEFDDSSTQSGDETSTLIDFHGCVRQRQNDGCKIVRGKN